MYGHRLVVCRYGANNPAPHMHSRPNGNWMRNFDNQVNMNWKRPYGNRFSPFEMEKVTNVICTICNNFGHVAMNCRRRTERGNVGPWKSSGMACYHYYKLGHLTKFYRSRKRKPVNPSKDQKGKQKVNVEETREKMNRIWKKKSDESPGEETVPSPNVDNLASVN